MGVAPADSRVPTTGQEDPLSGALLEICGQTCRYSESDSMKFVLLMPSDISFSLIPLPPPKSRTSVLQNLVQLQPAHLYQLGSHLPILISTSSMRVVVAFYLLYLRVLLQLPKYQHLAMSSREAVLPWQVRSSPLFKLISIPFRQHARFSFNAGQMSTNSLFPVGIHSILQSPGFLYPRITMSQGGTFQPNPLNCSHHQSPVCTLSDAQVVRNLLKFQCDMQKRFCSAMNV